MATIETDAVVLRTIRYSEADNVLTLCSADRGRVSAIAKGARRPKSRLGGRLQPGVVVRVTLHEGRGMGAVRGASVLHANAGLWMSGRRLRAASCVLDAAARLVAEDDPDPAPYNLVVRALGLIAAAPERPGPPRLDPLVLGMQVKLLVIGGLVPSLGGCVRCGVAGPLTGFSARAGGALCADCDERTEPLAPVVREALVGMIGRPLAEAPELCPEAAGPGVERILGLLLREHLGVALRSAAAPE